MVILIWYVWFAIAYEGLCLFTYGFGAYREGRAQKIKTHPPLAPLKTLAETSNERVKFRVRASTAVDLCVVEGVIFKLPSVNLQLGVNRCGAIHMVELFITVLAEYIVVTFSWA